MLYEIAGVRIDKLKFDQVEPGRFRIFVRLVPQMLEEGVYQDVDPTDLMLLQHPRMPQQWTGDFSEELELPLGPEGQAPPAQALGAAVLQWAMGRQQAAAEEWIGKGPSAFIGSAREEET